MFDEQDEIVQFKLSILQRALPASSAVVFGDMYIVEGAYAQKCAEAGCERVLLVDTLETQRWLDRRREHPALDFYKGDFSDPLFMASITEQFDVGVAFDIILHQAPMLGTLNLLLSKVGKQFCVVQPMLKEQALPNSLVYLPGNPAHDALYPLQAPSDEFKVFDAKQVNHSHWMWGMTPSFLTSALRGEGFEVTHEQSLFDLPNDNWFWWGCVAERVETDTPGHWSSHHITDGLFDADW